MGNDFILPGFLISTPRNKIERQFLQLLHSLLERMKKYKYSEVSASNIESVGQLYMFLVCHMQAEISVGKYCFG